MCRIGRCTHTRREAGREVPPAIAGRNRAPKKNRIRLERQSAQTVTETPPPVMGEAYAAMALRPPRVKAAAQRSAFPQGL